VGGSTPIDLTKATHAAIARDEPVSERHLTSSGPEDLTGLVSASTPTDTVGETRPKVSVCVPVRDEEGTLAVLLDSLLCQSWPPDEILLADGGSRDGTLALARRYAHHGVRILELGPAFPGRGRNAAIEAARNDWIALIDAGCTADPGWLAALLDSVAATGGTARVVFGNYRPRIRTKWDAAQAMTLVPPLDPATGCRPPSIASSLVHRSAWRVAGGFREELRAAEDLLFFDALRAAGVPTTRSPDAYVEWSLPEGPVRCFERLRLYSRHHLASGLYRTWHVRVMLMDVLAAAMAAAAFAWPPAGLAIAGCAATRLYKTVAPRRQNITSLQLYWPAHIARMTALLCLADMAAWAGAIDLLVARAVPAGHKRRARAG
jgi:hypothetical protein